MEIECQLDATEVFIADLIACSHICLGLPLDRAVRGAQLNIFLTVLESGILCMWPNQLGLRALM